MKVYDNLFCADEHQELPEWVAVELSERDEINIKIAQGLLVHNTQMHAVSFHLQGAFDFEGDYPLYTPIIHVSCDTCWVELHHRYGANVGFDLDYLESTEYVWNGKEVVET